MRRDWKYILYLSIAFGLFIAVKLIEPKQYNWEPTYAVEDKNPFGGYVLNELITDLFKGKNVAVFNLTVYELKDSLKPGDNLIVLSHHFRSDKEDTQVMLDHVAKGGHVFIGAESFRGKLSDTLKLKTDDYLFHAGLQDQGRDTSYLSFANSRLDSNRHYQFKRDNIHNYFASFDTVRTTIIAKNEQHQPVTIRVRWGKGSFILTCAPLAFSNIYALRQDNHEFMAITLSHLPEADVKWTEYYSVGRFESSTPLRFILTHSPLAWAYYITVSALLLFMIFEAKRKQRIIPIIPPLQNTSLEFIGTIGNLYYQRSDHKNIAEKKILFFLEMIRSRYLLSPGMNADTFVSQLARKAGKTEETVRQLFLQIDSVKGRASITKEELIALNKSIEAFTSTEKK
jgi:hypothetical protein